MRRESQSVTRLDHLARHFPARAVERKLGIRCRDRDDSIARQARGHPRRRAPHSFRPARRQDKQSEVAGKRASDTSRGVRCLSTESTTVIVRAGLPHQHHPLSEFLTLPAVLSHRGLVALFRATSAHRLQAFRASSAQPVVAPLGARFSLAVERRARTHSTPASEPCSD